jgi:hypothetical protein
MIPIYIIIIDTPAISVAKIPILLRSIYIKTR